MNIAICDDLEKDRDTLKEYIKRYFKKIGSWHTITCYSSAEEMLVHDEKNKKYNLIFLDVYMEQLTGIECAQKLRAMGCDSKIIFTTTSKDFALDAFKVHATDYMVKPYTYESFCETMNVIMKSVLENLKHIEITSNYEKHIIYLKDIYYIETQGRNTVLFTKGNKFCTIRTMQNFTDELCGEKNFFRCHRCCIVNFQHITGCQDDYYKFDNGSKV